MKWLVLFFIPCMAFGQSIAVDSVRTTQTPNQGRNVWNTNDYLLRDSLLTAMGFRDNGTNITLRAATDSLFIGTGTPGARFNFYGTALITDALRLGISAGTNSSILFYSSGTPNTLTLHGNLAQTDSRALRFPILTTANDTLLTYNLARTENPNVTLAGENYISIASQVITAAAINLGSSHTTDTLTMAKGGTNTVLTAANGGIVYSDANSLEILAPGTAGQILLSGGAGAPTWGTALTDNVTTNFIGYKSAASTYSDAVFWHNTNKTIGVDISTGLETDAGVQISKSSGSNYYYSNAFGGSPGFVGLHAAGTRALPTATANGNSIAIWGGRGYDGAAYRANPAGAWQAIATQLWTSTNQGTKLQAAVVADNTTTSLAPLDITSNGLEIRPGFNIRIFDADGSNVGIFAMPNIASNFTYTFPGATGDVAALSANGFAVRTAAQTYASRTLQAPAAGFMITAGNGVAGDPTFVLANDLAGVEGLSGDGIGVRTAADTWLLRDIVAGTNTTVTNGDGVAGNIAVNVADASTSAKGAVQLSTNGEATAGEVVQADDGRLFRSARRTTDTTTTSSVAGNLNGVAFSVSSGTVYNFIFTITYKSSLTTCGLEVALTGPTATTFSAEATLAGVAGDGASGSFQGYINAPGDSVTSAGVAVQDISYTAIIQGTFVPSASGTLQLQFSNDDNSNTITVQQGTNGMIWALP